MPWAYRYHPRSNFSSKNKGVANDKLPYYFNLACALGDPRFIDCIQIHNRVLGGACAGMPRASC
jgi:hypothetical protein